MATFKAGDLVVLKSGGPVMTVDEQNSYGVECVWFAGAKHEKARFKPDSIEITTKPAKK